MYILAICQKIKKTCWTLKFNIGVNGKPKIWNISKTAVRRAKLTNSLGLGGTTVILQCTYVGYF